MESVEFGRDIFPARAKLENRKIQGQVKLVHKGRVLRSTEEPSRVCAQVSYYARGYRKSKYSWEVVSGNHIEFLRGYGTLWIRVCIRRARCVCRRAVYVGKFMFQIVERTAHNSSDCKFITGCVRGCLSIRLRVLGIFNTFKRQVQKKAYASHRRNQMFYRLQGLNQESPSRSLLSASK